MSLRSFHWKILGYPPYSPDIATSDYHLFWPPRKDLASRKFHNIEPVKTAFRDCLRIQTTHF